MGLTVTKLVLDAINFDPRYCGGFKEWNEDPRHPGRKQPVIHPMTSGMMSFPGRGTKVPYFVKDEDIVHIDKGDVTWIVLRPVSDIPDIQQEHTVWHRISEDTSAKVTDLRDQLQDRDERITQLEQEIDKLQDSELAQKGRQDQSRNHQMYLRCTECGETSAENTWKSEERNGSGFCPECGMGMIEDAR